MAVTPRATDLDEIGQRELSVLFLFYKQKWSGLKHRKISERQTLQKMRSHTRPRQRGRVELSGKYI